MGTNKYPHPSVKIGKEQFMKKMPGKLDDKAPICTSCTLWLNFKGFGHGSWMKCIETASLTSAGVKNSQRDQP